MAGKGGARPGAGRKKGTPNKLTADVKSMILGALEDAGGQKYLARQAILNPVAFMTLLGKVIPKDIHAQGDFTLTVVTGVPPRDE